MDNFKPSYETYKKIISDIKETGKYCDYSNAIDKDEFILMRHDIEFSIERAYNLSLVESENGFYSTYFVQITNNFYNAFSLKNMILLKQMIDN